LDPGADMLDVWLIYGLSPVDSIQPGETNCQAALYSRTSEIATVVVEAASGTVDPRTPTEILSQDLDFSPDRAPVDSPTQKWPIYIGRLQRTDKGSAFEVKPTDRAFCGLVGRSIESPSGSGRMQIDGETPEQPSRFAIDTTNDQGTLIERWAIDRTGKVTITTPTSLEKNLRIADVPHDAPDGECWGLRFPSASAPPKTAMPWQIYRAAVPVKGGSPIQQLRIEMGAPDKKADPKSFLAAVCYPQGEIINHGLEVSSDLTVRVSGTLKVEGQLLEGSIPADASDPRFRAAVINAWASGVTAGAQAPLTATLLAQIGELDQNGANVPVQYSITVSNQGPGNVTSVHVYEVLALNGQTVEPTRDLDPQGFALKMSETRTFNRTYTPTAAGEFAIAITVIAVVPTGLTAQSHARRTFNIVTSQGGPG
jgi:hypothetical protein